MQFKKPVDWASSHFAFRGVRPNAGPNNLPGQDYCGKGIGGRNPQKSIDRGFFYVWADKIGTCRDELGRICVEGNYAPAWIKGAMETYQVFVEWPDTLWKQYKLCHEAYDDLLPKCRQNYLSKKRNLDAIRQREEEDALKEEVRVTKKRIKSDATLYQPFPEVLAVTTWLRCFLVDMLRYPILVVLGCSGSAKTEYAGAARRG